MNRMHEALHDAWRAFVQEHCLPARARRSSADLHHGADAALAWLTSVDPSDPASELVERSRAERHAEHRPRPSDPS
ncbi:MAG: hypothetical protein MUE69_27130 [Myxococcota bacterium]|jgi:hypothetical protein|nr:hypothetical protein [Myxococcota bacterium]